MACKAGYPQAPCPFAMMETGERVTRAKCGPCKEYEPPRHILKWCGLWAREQVLCMKPISACDTCPERSTKLNDKDPEDRRLYMEQYRKDHPDEIAAARERFFDKNPHYMRDYMRAYRAKLREKLKVDK